MSSSNLPINTLKIKSIDTASLATSQTGTDVDVREVLAAAIQTVWSGGSGAGGTIYIEGSIDGSNYNNIASTLVAADSGSFLVNLERMGYTIIRARWARTSGSAGTITATCTAKRM